jgi:hypothetical protein
MSWLISGSGMPGASPIPTMPSSVKISMSSVDFAA